MEDVSLYELLRLDPSATPEEICEAYLRISKRVHPDAGGSEALFRQVNAAYEVLRDPVRRAHYDRTGEVDAAAEETAPGWRRADPRDARREPGDAAPTSASGDAGSPGPSTGPEGDREPPPEPPPPPAGPPRPAPRPVSEVVSGVRHGARTHPSGALLIVGVLLLAVASDLPGYTVLAVLGGLVALVVGAVGVLGRSAVARRDAAGRVRAANLEGMTPSQFAVRLCATFEREGYTVYPVGPRGEISADFVCDAPGTRLVVHATPSRAPVDVAEVQRLVAAQSHYGAHGALLIAAGGLTPPARRAAQECAIAAWGRERLVDFLAADVLGPRVTGGPLLAEEIRTGAPSALRGMVLVLLGLASARSRGGTRRPRR